MTRNYQIRKYKVGLHTFDVSGLPLIGCVLLAKLQRSQVILATSATLLRCTDHYAQVSLIICQQGVNLLPLALSVPCR